MTKHDLDVLTSRLDIRDLVDRYALAVDQQDVDALVGLYTPDGEFERIQKTIVGTEDLRTFYAGMVARYHPTRHLPSVHVITELGPTAASGIQTGTAELGEDGVLLRAAYRFRDTYARLDGEWRFRRRSLRYMYVTEYSSLDSIFRSTDRIFWPHQDPMPGHFE
jgi:ketosteroid isomerase-like protein